MVDRSPHSLPAQDEPWLKRYYFTRTAFSVIWAALAFSIGRQAPAVAAVLLVIYPAWDALANGIDMSRSGGAGANRTQAINLVMSVAATAAVVVALQSRDGGVLGVLGVFGAWAIVAGLLQLGTAVRRWKSAGGQWPMILSGAQSALAGAAFFAQAHVPVTQAITRIGGYACVGALYFLIAAVTIVVTEKRRQRVRAS
ncbi:DUF308 domain-containing protein [Burkholderia plantarii]|uniref:DUF308 domain-containing protein n=1 Tax=Burkholderia plantarii TaxID=41899 RepID=UPI0018DBA4A0|nr:DUF308 domain-containing protein [Burkholderia plantarii]MBI0326746.1 DUF308 domain-containing protein [Burkholderia plantarii]